MKKQKSTWIKIRKLFNDIHLWLGLISGIIIFFVCLSGTIYTYNTEITQAAEPHLYHVKTPVQKSKQRFTTLALSVQVPDSLILSSIQVPFAPNKSYGFQYKSPDGNRRNSKTYFVNPYTAELLGTNNPDNSAKKWMGYMFSLHRWLLLDKIEKPIFGEFPNRKLGSLLTGICTILFTIGVITGLVIWFPNKLRGWKQGLKIKTGGSWKRTNHDLHNTLGFYSCIILFLMGITGPFFSFEWYRNGLRKTLGTFKAPTERNEGGKRDGKTGPKKEEATHEATFISFPIEKIETIINNSNKVLPYKGDYRINYADGTFSVDKTKIGFFAPAASDKITFDATGTKVLKVEKFSDKKFNEKISSSIKAIHIGNVFGGFSKLIYFISCLIATSLPITGTLIWINKFKKKKNN